MKRHHLEQRASASQTITKSYIQSLNILGMSYKELEKTISDFADEHPLIEIDPHYHTSHLDYEALPLSVSTSFKDDLLFQLRTSRFENTACAEAIIDVLDDNGYFNSKCELNFPSDEIERCLKFIQTLLPHGVGARNLKECLLLQIRYSNSDNKKNMIYLLDYLPELAKRRFSFISEKSGLSVEEIKIAFSEIKKLNPKPCANHAPLATALHPDVQLEIIDDEVAVTIRDITQYLSITQYDLSDEETKRYIQNQLKEINAFMSHIQKRNTTLLQICTVIFQLQKDYFALGRPLKPMTLSNIASHTGHHISTISRCIMNKTFEFQNQTYPFRFLFTAKTKAGYGADAIKTKILFYIRSEKSEAPYTDTQLSELLKHDNLSVSRRIITKYREQMQIPNARERKK